ncbi:MAG: hypothetical protein ACRDQA_07500 [Nocardioidaceae bacterium]
MPQATPDAPPARDQRGRDVRLLTPKQAGKEFFGGASENTVRRLIASGDLRAVDIAPPGSGRTKTRVRSDDCVVLIEARTRTAPSRQRSA